jgi:hypothetical protein
MLAAREINKVDTSVVEILAIQAKSPCAKRFSSGAAGCTLSTQNLMEPETFGAPHHFVCTE